MTRWICKQLTEMNIIPTLAWYAPWRNYPSLSVPMHKLIRGKKAGYIKQEALDHYAGFGIGAWLPELEFTHYIPSGIWGDLITKNHLHLAVSGNALSALPYTQSGHPF